MDRRAGSVRLAGFRRGGYRCARRSGALPGIGVDGVTLDIAAMTSGLERRGDGIWEARASAPVSYPSDGSERCFEVEDASFWFAHRQQIIVDALQRFEPRRDRPFIDIGGGNGHVSHGIAQAGYPVVLVEPSGVGARNARSRGLGNVVCATLESAQFRPGSLPLAGLFDVLEHIEDDVAALKSVRCAMLPGGLVFLTVPAHGWLQSEDDVIAGHFRRYTCRSLARTLQSAGFEVVHSTYAFAVLVLPILLLRTVPSRLGLHSGFDAERQVKEHSSRGILQRSVEAMLAQERRHLARGGTLAMGASCLAIGRVPP